MYVQVISELNAQVLGSLSLSFLLFSLLLAVPNLPTVAISEVFEPIKIMESYSWSWCNV